MSKNERKRQKKQMWIIRDINQKQKSTIITNNHKDTKPL